ncbi:MAG: hypothetical protein KDC98_21515 [Planctomycetes bacterium]|nr:hypothetical protein [Planctomycetota bacterium]
MRLRDRVVYLAARLAIGIAARVPERLGYGLAGLLGRFWFRVDRRRRGYALHFLQNAYSDLSESELLRIGARSTANLFKVPLDMARLTRLLDRGGTLDEVCDFSEAEAVLASTKQFLGFTAHLGSWEVGAAAVAHRVGEAHGIARVTRNPLLQRWILANRERAGLHIHARRGGLRDLAAAMERGACGLQVVDQNQRLRGVFAPFFGEIASCERAAVTLALRHGYPLVAGVGYRVGPGFRFRLALHEPFVPTKTGDRALDLYNGVVEVNRRLEEMIRRAPEQYLWIHDRYRKKPPPGWQAGDDGAGDEDGDGDGAGA